jgi:hypothetical protein
MERRYTSYLMVNCYDENMREFSMSNIQTKTNLEIFYQILEVVGPNKLNYLIVYVP